eukprot:s7266_g5.t1
MYESLAEQATESDWSEEEKRAWYRERPDDAEYYRVQRDLLRNGRKAKLTQLPPVREGDPLLWAIGLSTWTANRTLGPWTLARRCATMG